MTYDELRCLLRPRALATTEVSLKLIPISIKVVNTTCRTGKKWRTRCFPSYLSSHLDLDGLLEADLPLLLGDLLLLLDRDLLLDRPLLLLLERPLDRERDLLLDRDLPPPPRLSSRTLSLRPSSSRSSLWSRAYSRPRRSANSTRPSPWRGVCTLV